MITVEPWLVDVSGAVVVAADVVATVLSDVPANYEPQRGSCECSRTSESKQTNYR